MRSAIAWTGLFGLLLPGLWLGLPACDPGSRAAKDGNWRLVGLEAVDSGGRFVVTPRWSPSGERLLVSGRGGVGLSLIDPGRRTIADLEPGFRGLARWSVDGRVVVGSRVGEDGFESLFDDGVRRVRFKPYSGRVVAGENGEERVLVEGNAWGVRVSADGRRVAYCLGHLTDAQMNVVSFDGERSFEGAGAQPEWLPDGRRLVYTLPRAGEGAGLSGADLYLLDLEVGESVRLTHGAGRVDMQPAVGPDGQRLAFVDWSSGRMYLARLVGTGGGS